MTGNIHISSFHPAAVERMLEQASFKRYINSGSRHEDWAFAEHPVFPTLYRLVIRNGLMVPDEAVTYLIRSVYGDNWQAMLNKPAVLNRARKLVQDFYRELHAMGLLQQVCAQVSYEKGLDIGYNVDFLCVPMFALMNQEQPIGVQVTMMAPWRWERIDAENFLKLKTNRRKRRAQLHPDQIRDWSGPTYLLSNKDRDPAKSISGVWLFGATHIKDLMDEIRGNSSESNGGVQAVAVQTEYWD